ncbi:hypothetical protein LTS72_06970 [Mycobacterium ostraviense]|uniref:glycoside hydrolase family 19 protein n=1 Tax=Mycobacterium ostraviense TaxID=2738409 RepID=UPI000C06D732|nr:glycoside hydrolase family 19 protein [Mycobacterium ostraviense]UGT93058.1 hypothetical protein LTS72_06970 [Mycobacterium ostraviense]
MEPLTPDDVRRWDLSTIQQVFKVATDRATTLQRLGDNLQEVKDILSQWHGEGREAFHSSLGKNRTDIEADGQESARVGAVVQRAEEDIRQCKSMLNKVDELARANHWTVTPGWQIDIGNTGVGRGHDLQFITTLQLLQADLDEVRLRAHAADHELATALRAAVGEAPLDQTRQPTPAPAVDSPPDGITAEQLRQIMPTLSPEKAAQYLPMLDKAMAEAQINKPQRRAAFLAQLAHESGELKWFEEFADGSAYEGRTDLGNIQPGDGPRFKGRGPIQITGRSNYTRAGQALGVDLANNPDLAARPDIGFRIAQWYWTTHNLNILADGGPANFDDITRAINGGLTNKADRDQYYATALRVLGAH